MRKENVNKSTRRSSGSRGSVGRAVGLLYLYGRSSAGRALLVVLVESADGRWYVATARDLSTGETGTFRKKGR